MCQIVTYLLLLRTENEFRIKNYRRETPGTAFYGGV